MGLTIIRFTSCMVLLISLLSLASLGGAKLQVYEGGSVTLENSNTTIIWGQNYSFNVSRLTVSNDTLSIGGQNISITSNTTGQVSATLWQYNLSNPDYGDTLIKIGAEPVNRTVHFRFTGVPTISSDKYQLRTPESELDRFSTGGAVTWSYAGDSAQNFTVSYEEVVPPDNDGGDSDSGSSGGGGGGVFIPAGISDSQSWISTNEDRFNFKSIDENVGVESVTVSTDRNLTGFSITVARLREPPSLPELPENTYDFYEFTAKHESQITSTEIEFKVNKSFAEKHDEVVISRYNDGWKDLPTTRIESTGNTWSYRTTAPGFSYYTVRGVSHGSENNQKPSNKDNQTTDNDTQEPICGDNTCNADETWNTCQQDCEKPEKAVEAEQSVNQAEQQITKGENGYKLLQQARQQLQAGNYTTADRLAREALKQNQSQKNQQLPLVLIITGLALMILLSAAGYLGYRKWLNNRISSEITQIQQEVTERVRTQHIEDRDELIEEIDEAEDHLDNGSLHRVQKHLERVIQELG